MGKQKPGTMIYWEMFDVLERLKPEQALLLISAIRQYAQNGQKPAFDDETLTVVWPLFAQKIATDNERYVERCKKATAAINSRWEKPGNTSVYERIPNIPTTSPSETKTSSASTAMKDPTKMIMTTIEARECFGNAPGVHDVINELVLQHGVDKVKRAMSVCHQHNAHTLAYLRKVLQQTDD